MRESLAFGSRLYREKAETLYHGYQRRDPMALLRLRPGRESPSLISEQLRAQGVIARTRFGNWVTTSHPLCSEVLRDGRLGARPDDFDAAAEDEFDPSFLDLNHPQVYDRPQVYDVTRPAGVDQLVFSAGIHYCLGQPLARLEAVVALRPLADRLPGLALAGPVWRRNATTIRGPQSCLSRHLDGRPRRAGELTRHLGW